MLASLVILAALVLAGCSSDDETSSSTTTTTTSRPGATTTTTGDGSSTTAKDASATTTTPENATATTAAPSSDPDEADPDAPPPEDYSGPFDGQEGDTTISFTRGAEVSSVEIEGLDVQCERVDNTGGTRTVTIDLSFPKVPVAEDGSVDITLPDAKYQPSLSGSFGPDGVFSGAVFLSFREDGYACGGDYTFIAKPR